MTAAVVSRCRLSIPISPCFYVSASTLAETCHETEFYVPWDVPMRRLMMWEVGRGEPDYPVYSLAAALVFQRAA